MRDEVVSDLKRKSEEVNVEEVVLKKRKDDPPKNRTIMIDEDESEDGNEMINLWE